MTGSASKHHGNVPDIRHRHLTENNMLHRRARRGLRTLAQASRSMRALPSQPIPHTMSHTHTHTHRSWKCQTCDPPSAPVDCRCPRSCGSSSLVSLFHGSFNVFRKLVVPPLLAETPKGMRLRRPWRHVTPCRNSCPLPCRSRGIRRPISAQLAPQYDLTGFMHDAGLDLSGFGAAPIATTWVGDCPNADPTETQGRKDTRTER